MDNPLRFIDPNGMAAVDAKPDSPEEEDRKNNEKPKQAQVIPLPIPEPLPSPIPPTLESAKKLGESIIKIVNEIDELGEDINLAKTVVTLGVTEWFINLFAEHTKKRPSTWDKHTKPKSGRETEKKKQKDKGWKENPNKRKK